MKVLLDEAQMLGRWKLLTLLEPLRSGSEVTRTDYVDLDALCRLRMRAWYLDLLDRGDPSLLVVRDVAELATITPESDGTTLVTLPSNVRRVLGLRMEGWSRSVAPLRDEEAREALRRGRNHYLRGGSCSPVVVAEGAALRILTPTPPSGSLPPMLTAIVEPDDGSYELDEKAFALITPGLMTTEIT